MKQRGDKIPDASKPRAKEALQRLVRLYEATGQLQKAAEWTKQASGFEQPEAGKQRPASKP